MSFGNTRPVFVGCVIFDVLLFLLSFLMKVGI
jgi:hypothetical protein